MRITLPLPDSKLWPNAARRLHWAVKGKLVKKHRGWAKTATQVAMWGEKMWKPRWKQAGEKATFYFKTRRRRDPDGALSALKSIFDGIVDAGLLDDDSGLTHYPVKFEIDKDDPRLEIEIWRTVNGEKDQGHG